MRRIKLTKEGRRFLLAVALIGIASLNTGNNLIYLIFSLMLSLAFISFSTAFINVYGLTCTLDLREPLYANSSFKIDVEIKNRKIISSYSISIEVPLGIHEPLYVPFVKKGTSRHSFKDITINKRGKYLLRNVMLKTGFPFIFMYAYRPISYRREIIIYPHLFDARHLLSDIQQDLNDNETMRRGQDGDFLSAREYVYGEESRNIDWKATAKMQKTMVREYSRRDNRLATIILDNSMAGNDVAFENSVSASASICSEFIERGYHVRLITGGKVVPFGNGQSHMLKMLDILAEIEQVNAVEFTVPVAIEGVSILIVSSDVSGFSQLASRCSRVIDARNI